MLALKKLAVEGTMGALHADGDELLVRYCEEINNLLDAGSERKKTA